ncbi:MAG: MBL fold metallo-hydrolase [Marinilabiliaceae bacterium]|nr:MBL fold metallo-hydrolase [Marinilabiliaceae bacterium]
MAQITTLVENRVSGKNLKCEHGLSFHIQTSSGSYLFDTGQSGKFIENALKLGIDLSQVDAVVLSHGHYDHAGGLLHFLEVNDRAKVYLHPQALKERFSRSAEVLKSNGIPWRNEWQQFEDRFVFVDEPMKLEDGIHMLPNIQSVPDYKVLNPRLVVEKDGVLVPDHFEDELLLVLKEENEPVVFCGCAHNGIVNILHHIKQQLGMDRFQLVIGGLHLAGQGQEEIQKVLEGITKFEVQHWALNHCTGDEAIALFKQTVFGQVSYADTGSQFNV